MIIRLSFPTLSLVKKTLTACTTCYIGTFYRNTVSHIEMNNSVTKAIQLLEELSRVKQPLALGDLARGTHLNKATAYRLLNALCQKGLAQKVGRLGVYALGPKLLALAEEYRRSFTMRDRVLPYLDQLVRATGETAIYCERHQQDCCVTIEKRESPHQTRTVIETGVPRPLYAGSSAMAILAMLPQEEILSVLKKRPLEKFTPYTPTSVNQILKKLEVVRRRGYAVSVQERYSYTAGIAAPCVLGENVFGSIAVIGPTERIKATGVAKIGRIVRSIAMDLSAAHSDGETLRAKGLLRRLQLVR
jgi:IclR family transcriptional regulator, KDG regulon repressor